jgi:tRNA(fMet)-specific endonuclease VapC
VNPRYLLDTNVLSDLVRQPQGRIHERIARAGEDQVCTSVVVAAELRYGAQRKASPRLMQQVAAILGALPILPFEADMDATYARIRCSLEKSGEPIGGNDLIIAAQALHLGCTLVTANTREFRRVRGLQVEDWLAPLRAARRP